MDTVWHYMVDIDPGELTALRTKQKAYVARYGRQPLTVWQELDVGAMHHFIDALADLMKNERATTTVAENGD